MTSKSLLLLVAVTQQKHLISTQLAGIPYPLHIQQDPGQHARDSLTHARYKRPLKFIR